MIHVKRTSVAPLPCPFCGNPEVGYTNSSSVYHVECPACWAGGPRSDFMLGMHSQAQHDAAALQAAQLWNRRSP